MAAVYVSNIIINTGTDFEQVFTLENSSTNDPLNLTSYTVASQMRKHAGSSSYIDFDATVANASLGRVQIGLTTSVTSTLKSGRYIYDIVITDSFGKKTRAIEGMVLVREGATK